MADIWHADFAGAPPFAPLRAWAEALAGPDWPCLERLNALAEQHGIVNARGLPIRFRPQHLRCGQRDYEAGILATGEVSTRAENWHDLLNALAWLAYPATKAALNATQTRSLAGTAGRGPESDAATLFDESGLVLAGPDATLAHRLADKHWHETFVARRDDWKHFRCFAVGHAVLEKLLTPWPGITAKCLYVPLRDGNEDERETRARVDAAAAKVWRDGAIQRPAQLFPMPVLGIPGWWPGNESPAFYQDKAVFRPARA